MRTHPTENLTIHGSASLSVLFGLVACLGDKRACKKILIGPPGRACELSGSSGTAITG